MLPKIFFFEKAETTWGTGIAYFEAHVLNFEHIFGYKHMCCYTRGYGTEDNIYFSFKLVLHKRTFIVQMIWIEVFPFHNLS